MLPVPHLTVTEYIHIRYGHHQRQARAEGRGRAGPDEDQRADRGAGEGILQQVPRGSPRGRDKPGGIPITHGGSSSAEGCKVKC